jgi:hypothetical protein
MLALALGRSPVVSAVPHVRQMPSVQQDSHQGKIDLYDGR